MESPMPKVLKWAAYEKPLNEVSKDHPAIEQIFAMIKINPFSFRHPNPYNQPTTKTLNSV
jgi:hypothetical protein